jgi:hypothetical protein
MLAMMMINQKLVSGTILVSAMLVSNVQPEQAAPAPSSVIPIMFSEGIDASKAKSGDVVTATIIQTVWLHGSEIRKGAKVVGHVALARGFTFDPAPYARQQPSILSIRFDKVITKDSTADVVVWVRALADPVDSSRAREVEHFDEHDSVGTIVQIGGDSFRPNEEPVFSLQGDIVAYNRKGEVFARLLPGEYSSRYSRIHCDGTNSEEPVARFSANACGLYGFKDVYLADNGTGEQFGTFRLESRRRSVKLYKGSAALLQIME